MPENAVADLTHTIQTAVAPVFLLTAVGTILNVLSGRLSRIVDRARFLSERVELEGAKQRASDKEELYYLEIRRGFINYAITCAVVAALLVCVLISVIFAGFMFDAKVANVIAILFISVMTAFTGALVLFLREIMFAVRRPGFR